MEQPIRFDERINATVTSEQMEAVSTLANRYHGDNVSRLIRTLIDEAWEREQAKDKAA